MIYTSVSQLIGSTPLLEAVNIEKQQKLGARIAMKLECMNPAGSAKDRVARKMIDEAEARGLLSPGAVIIEPTSGNTGVGLAAVGTARGYRVILTMPDTMSIERRSLLKAYGGEVVLTEGKKGMSGAIEKANELAASINGAFIPSQFDNPANPQAHYETTGPELWHDTAGKIDIFVAGIGTGGTISGTARYLKEQSSAIRIVGVEPAGSPVITKGTVGPHKIQGIGAGFIPKNLDLSLVDEVLAVRDEDALDTQRLAARAEGVLVGISSGAALFAAMQLARRPENAGKLIVAFLTDTGERYLSMMAL